jgi:hypothetical protein
VCLVVGCWSLVELCVGSGTNGGGPVEVIDVGDAECFSPLQLRFVAATCLILLLRLFSRLFWGVGLRGSWGGNKN